MSVSTSSVTCFLPCRLADHARWRRTSTTAGGPLWLDCLRRPAVMHLWEEEDSGGLRGDRGNQIDIMVIAYHGSSPKALIPVKCLHSAPILGLQGAQTRKCRGMMPFSWCIITTLPKRMKPRHGISTSSMGGSHPVYIFLARIVCTISSRNPVVD